MTAPIRMVAQDLYRLQKEVERLENLLKRAHPDQRAALEDELRKAVTERDRMHKVLEGSKDPSPYRKPL
ncbi:MAG: hypothetical protein ACOWYE_05975 [Desulfatiglandales bacterium]